MQSSALKPRAISLKILSVKYKLRSFRPSSHAPKSYLSKNPQCSSSCSSTSAVVKNSTFEGTFSCRGMTDVQLINAVVSGN